MEKRRLERIKSVLARRQPDLTLIADHVNNSRNLSAIIRSCEAVGIMEVHWVHSEPQKEFVAHSVSLGAEKWVKLTYHQDIKQLILGLKQKGYSIYAAHVGENTVSYRTVDYTVPCAIIVGAERDGVSPEAMSLADKHIHIPMMGMTQSLNVSVAAAVILFEAQRQREAKGYYQQMRLSPETYREILREWTNYQADEVFSPEDSLVLTTPSPTPTNPTGHPPDGF
ncbi:MAG: RNA methyltransferase [Geminocystis sp.]|nr:RNA methyltransferase [Geminocystis sp.]HIK36717.1 tRNA (guanine-N2)-dimethyltransferase [Geminocystis sp. M7585_C2015_104]MCS7146797.1 RNA methyltransferase [Geminocystis sp.]MCX8077053.1 RNA methyltransferase [Geminocystis sp.]MDW8115623.1 RNA methyltransferase [Geminocystis sp.]